MAMQWPGIGEACCAAAVPVEAERRSRDEEGAAVLVGIDWAERHRDLCVMAADASVLARERITDGVAGVARLHEVIALWAEEPAQVMAGSRPIGACWSGRWWRARYQVGGGQTAGGQPLSEAPHHLTGQVRPRGIRGCWPIWSAPTAITATRCQGRQGICRQAPSSPAPRPAAGGVGLGGRQPAPDHRLPPVGLRRIDRLTGRSPATTPVGPRRHLPSGAPGPGQPAGRDPARLPTPPPGL